MVQSGAEVAGICATNDQLDESRPALTTRIKSRHELRSETADAVASWLSTPSAPFALAPAKQGQLHLWLASTAIYGNQSPSVPATEKTLKKVDHSPDPSAEIIFRTGVAQENLIGPAAVSVLDRPRVSETIPGTSC